MAYLLDTNVVSELRKRQPDANLVGWLRSAPADGLYLSVIVVGEIRRGVEKLIRRGDTRQANRLDTWLAELQHHFEDRILPVTVEIADEWGSAHRSAPGSASRRRAGGHRGDPQVDPGDPQRRGCRTDRSRRDQPVRPSLTRCPTSPDVDRGAGGSSLAGGAVDAFPQAGRTCRSSSGGRHGRGAAAAWLTGTGDRPHRVHDPLSFTV